MTMKYYYPIITWGVLIVFLLYQVIVPPSIVSAKGDLLTGSIAGIDVGDKKISDIEALLATEVTKWKENDLIVQGTTAKIVIPSNYIQFDIKNTAQQYISASAKPWYNFLSDDKKVQLPLNVSVDEKIYEALKEAPYFFVDETIEAIVNHASYLQSGPVEAQEVVLTKDLLSRVSFESQEVVVNTNGLSAIIEAVNDTTLLNGESFSFLEKLMEAGNLYNEETANFIASTLYSAVLKSEMEIQERHSQHRLSGYLVPGIEVKVDAKRKQDFAFVNNTNRPVIITAFVKENRLVIELYSFESGAKVTYDVLKLEVVQPRTIYRLTATLPAGQEKVLEEGKNGLRVQVNRQLPGGELEVISRDFYPPIDTVILVSSLTPPVSMIEPGEITPTEPQPQVDTSTNPPSSQTTSNKDDSTAGEESALTDENGKPIPEGATYDKGGNLITSDPQ
ncbi:VanW family protein [Sporosarcina sp. YIM B06819]|uniref:VanW family protein n=1 Tax=Sporosarcina sp. YIM B06819 TaxID=3081769 RepID=UPI00298CA877|nr:VanW family protein [Sporosarcina sp. YIM B06819]